MHALADDTETGGGAGADATGSRWLTLGLAAVVVLLTVVAYQNAAPRAAVHDDKFFVPGVFHLDAHSVATFFREDAWGAAGTPGGRYRPLLLLTFAVDEALFGDDMRGYHVTNIVVHVLVTLAFYLVLVVLLRRFGPRSIGPRMPPLAAAVAAVVFGVHPILTEAVDSVFNRSEMLVALCCLAAFGAILRWERRSPTLAWTLVSAAFFIALLVRENAAILPPLIAGFVWFLHPEEPWRERFWRVAPVVALGLPFVAYLLMRQSALGEGVQATAPSLAEHVGDSALIGDRIALYLTAMREYVRMMVWPHPLRASYLNFAPTGVLVAVVVHVVVLGAAVLTSRRLPWLAFGIGFFYVALLPSTRLLTEASSGSGFLGQSGGNLILVAERAMYLPSVGIALALGFGLQALGARVGAAGVVACGVALAAVLIPVTRARNHDWRTETALWEADVAADPENGDAFRLLTGTYVGLGRHEETARICDRELAKHPRLAQLANNCGIAYQGRDRVADAEAAYHRAIDAGLESVGHANLGRLLDRTGRTREAEEEYARAVETEQEPGRRHYRRGQLLLRFHPDRLAEAEQEFRNALAILPHWSQARNALDQVRALRAKTR